MKLHPIPLNSYGKMTVWIRRNRDNSTPKYFVQNDETCRVLEDFRRLSSARKWARTNANG